MNTLKTNLNFVLSFALFFSLFFNNEKNIYLFYFVFFINLIFFCFCVFSNLKVKIEPFLYFYMVFFAWCLLSMFWSRDFSLAFDMIGRLIVLILCFLICINLNNEKNSLLLGGYFGLVTGLFLNLLLIPFEGSYIVGRFSGTTINPNHIALFSSFVLFLTVIMKKHFSKLFIYLVMLLCILLIIQTGSRKGVLLALIVIALFTFKLDEKTFSFSYVTAFTIPLLFSFLLMFFNLDYLSTVHSSFERFYDLTQVNINDVTDSSSGDSSSRWRLIFIIEGFNLFLNNPITGIGLDNFKTIFSVELYSHNNFIELLSTLGSVGLILYYLFYFILFKPIMKQQLMFGMCIMLLLLLMDFAMVTYFERMYLLPLILIYYSTYREEKIESSPYN